MSIVWPVPINSAGSMEHGGLLWLYRGSVHVSLVFRTSYALGAGPLTSVPADPVDHQDRHYGNHPAHPVRTASDLVPHLPRAEIIHAGAVFAPSGTTRVRLSVMRQGKAIIDKRAVAMANHPCPGLGPLGRHSAERLAFLRNGPEPQVGADGILRLPDHTDFDFFQCAPHDQQCDQIDGGDQVLLQNLLPDQPEFTFVLPSRAPTARAYLGPEEAHLLLECKRVVIDTDRRRVTLNWYADVELPSTNAIPYLRVVANAPDNQASVPNKYEPTVRLALSKDLWDIDDPRTMDVGALRPDARLPFANSPPSPQAPAAPTATTPWGQRDAVSIPEVGTSTVGLRVPDLPPLPPLDFSTPGKPQPPRAAPSSTAATPWGKREEVAVPDVEQRTVALKVPELPPLPPLDFSSPGKPPQASPSRPPPPPPSRPSHESPRSAPAAGIATPWAKREDVAVPDVEQRTVALKRPELPPLPPLDFSSPAKPPPAPPSNPSNPPRVEFRDVPRESTVPPAPQAPPIPQAPPSNPSRALFREAPPEAPTPPAPQAPPKPQMAPAAAAAAHPKKGAYDRFKR